VIEVPRRRMLPRVRVPRVGRRGLAAVAALIAILAGAFFWVRQSSLVAVQTVAITGVTGPDAPEIRTALRGAALGMSTFDVDSRRLHQVVAPYPVVDGLRLRAHFPHGLQIEVAEQIPVAVLVAGDRRTVVSADGALLAHPRGAGLLPTISLPVEPGGSHLTGPGQADVRLLAAAPYALLAKVETASQSTAHGLMVTLRDGPTVYFGDGSRLAAKWRSVISVLADPSSSGASYIDVTDPARPAAGAGSDTTGTPVATTGSATATTGDPGLTSTSTTG
jgi:cell division protein FtsQ